MSAYSANKPMLFAKEAKELSQASKKMSQTLFIQEIKEQLDDSIMRAITEGMTETSVKVPAGVEPKLVDALCKVLRKLGYGAGIQHFGGGYYLIVSWKE